MIRNRRGEGPVQFTKRNVSNVNLQLSPEEQALYDGVTSFVKDQYQEAGGNLSSMLSLVTLQREVQQPGCRVCYAGQSVQEAPAGLSAPGQNLGSGCPYQGH